MAISTVQGVPAFPPANSPHKKKWYRPTFSPEHGVLLVLLGAVLTGASVAQAWTVDTSWACLAAFLGLQAEHPLIVQVKQRRRWRPRYLVWTGVYGGLALLVSLWLSFRHPVLIWVLVAGVIALGLDVLAIFQHKHKAVANEIMMFSAICLSTLLIYGATADTMTTRALGMWILNSLFFSSAVFSVKLRKKKTSSLRPGIFYHGIAIALVLALYMMGWLSIFTALVFSIALLKLAVIICWKNWYLNCRFEHVARFETYFALTYTCLAALTVLPPKLPPVA